MATILSYQKYLIGQQKLQFKQNRIMYVQYITVIVFQELISEPVHYITQIAKSAHSQDSLTKTKIILCTAVKAVHL